MRSFRSTVVPVPYVPKFDIIIVTMKKIILMVAVAMMTAMNVNAQNENLHHELSLSYGFGSIAQFGDGIGEGLGLAFTNTEYDDGSIVGPITLEYFYHFNNPRLAIGGSFTYSKWDSDVLVRNSQTKVGERNRNFFSVMPAFKSYWVNKNHFGLYSKVAAGIGFLQCTDNDYETHVKKDDNGCYFMFQLSFIGVEFGSKFRGFAEAGIGDQGFIQAGIRYKF